MPSEFDKEPCCGISLLKYILFIFNFFLLLGGGAVLGVGIWTLITKYEYVNLLCNDAYTIATYTLIVSGAIVIIVAAMGCIGAVQEHKCCLLFYFTLLLFICLVELIVGVFVYAYRGQIEVELEKCLNESITINYGMDGQDSFTKEYDSLQETFKCCGAGSYLDWKSSEWKLQGKAGNLSTPATCCITYSPYCSVRDHHSNIHRIGCVEGLTRFLQDHLVIVGAVCVAIAGVEIFGLVFSMCLYCHLKYEEAEPY
ncbi:CD151 antigen-like [Amphiura filiformis]|uniref:CD151 antigen-like n=1 Tax=Amphiura filiformis TaxID=82378 RepID=UPI003B222740